MTEALACLAGRAPDELPGASIHTIRLPNHGSIRDRGTLGIRLATSGDQISSANSLLNRMYSWRGYGSDHLLPSAPHCATFAASCDDEVIGTLTLTVDSAAGLAADETFASEIKALRGFPGTKLCELTKFAFDPTASSRPLLAALFHIIFIYGSHRYGCTDLLIEVNPRHRRFYEVMLGFRSVGDVKINRRVDAPAHLLWLKVSDIRRHIDEHNVSRSGAGRSLYSHFFSADQEQGIYACLAGAPLDTVPFVGEAASGVTRNGGSEPHYAAALAA
jgi:hypothetical protein